MSLPPKERKFVTCSSSITASSIQIKGSNSSRISSRFPYKNYILFYESIDEHDGFISTKSIERIFIQTLNQFKYYTGRMTNIKNIVNRFDKGALFEVIESINIFNDYKEKEFLKSQLPELVSLNQYNSFDAPLCGLKLTKLRDGGIIIGISLFRHITDTTNEINFLQLFCNLGKNGINDAPLNFLWHHQLPIQNDEPFVVYCKSRNLSLVTPYNYTKTTLNSIRNETDSIVHILNI